MRSEETKLLWPGLTQGSTYHHIDFYQRVGDNIIHGNFTDEDPSAIREQYNQQQYLPMESFLNDTSRNVIDPSFSQYDHNAPYHGYQQPCQPLQPPQPASSWESRYSLGLSASNPEIAPSVIPTTPDAYFVQPHLWNDTVSNTRHTSDYGSGFHDGAYGSYGGSFYTPNPSTPANRQVLQVPTPSPWAPSLLLQVHLLTLTRKPSGSAYFYCPKPHCNKEFTNSNHLK